MILGTRKPQLLQLLLMVNLSIVGLFQMSGHRENNKDEFVKKGPAKAVFLRQLNKFRLKREFLVQLYRCASIESILAFSICMWFVISQRQRSKLEVVVRTATNVAGTSVLLTFVCGEKQTFR